jgi:hypothetical protein
MASRSDLFPVDSCGDRKVILTGVLVLGDDGAITSQSCDGFSVELTGSEAGRYTVTLADYWTGIEYAHAVVEGAADAAYTDQKGAVVMLRGVSVSTKTMYIQLMGLDGDGDFADRDAENSTTLRILIVANRGLC